MRHLRPFLALLVISAITVACSSPGGGSTAESDGGGGGEATATPDGGGGEATATPDGGGGGGGGANGSITYEISGDYDASGELPFVPLGLSLFDSSTGGWVGYFAEDSANSIIQINTQAAGQIINFGDGTAVVIGVSDADSGSGCAFTMTKNDASGLAGHVECTSAQLLAGDGTMGQVNFNAQWDAHL